MRSWSNFTIYSLLVLVTFILYSPTLGFLFLGDDWDIIIKNSALFEDLNNLKKIFFIPVFSKGLKGGLYKYYEISDEVSYRPFNTFSYFIDYNFWGLTPFGYHLTNIIIHAINGCLIYRIASFLISYRLGAFLGAIFFLIQPVQVEAVSVASFREDLLALMFSLVSLLLFLLVLSEGGKKIKIGLFLVYLFYIFALLSKENTSVLPFIFIFVFLYYRRKIQLKDMRVRINLFLFLSLITGLFFAFLRIFYTPPGNINYRIIQAGLGREISTVLKCISYYLNSLILPLNLKFYLIGQFKIVDNLDINFILTTLPVVIFLILISLIIFHKNLIPGLKIGAFWLSLFLAELCWIRYLPSVFAFRYLYFPMFGLALIVSEISRKFLQKGRRWQVYFVLLLLFLYSFFIWKSRQEMQRWRNEVTFWEKMKQDFPLDFNIYYNYGNCLFSVKLFWPALKEYLNAYLIAPENRLLLEKVAVTFLCLQQYDEAEKFYKKILEKNPQALPPYNGLGVIAGIESKKEEALRWFQKGLKIEPSNGIIIENIERLKQGEKQFKLIF